MSAKTQKQQYRETVQSAYRQIESIADILEQWYDIIRPDMGSTLDDDADILRSHALIIRAFVRKYSPIGE